MIKAFKVQNLNKKYNFDFQFNDDLNIFTGKNGSGKTTLLKTMWYILSGNLKKVVSEVYIDHCFLETENEMIDLNLYNGKNKDKSSFSFKSNLYIEKSIKSRRGNQALQDFLTEIPSFQQGSSFFPTFRRIEGGFSIEQKKNNANGFEFELYQMVNKLFVSSSLDAARNLSNEKHQFIASIATDDIDTLLSKKYANISEEILKIEKQQSNFVLQSIANSSGDEKSILLKIKNRQQETILKKEELLKPFNLLSKLIKDIFDDKGIQITDSLLFGDAAKAIFSDKLSAGEKQMLSFLAYCMFTKNSVIFIDEPELSLHPDWQRLLMPTLLEIAPTNQFFIATHSPFIYAKYPDKEIILDKDKGGA